MLPEKGYKRIMVICFYILLGALGLYLFSNYLFKWLWPIIVAAIVGTVLQPVIRFLEKKLRFPHKLAAILTVLVLYIGVGYLLGAVVYKLLTELSVLASSIPGYVSKLNINLGNIEAYFKSMFANMPIIGSADLFDIVWSNLSSSIVSMLSGLSSSIITSLPSFLTSVAQLVPSLLLAIIIMIVSSVYFATDYEKIKSFFGYQMSAGTKEKIRSARDHLFRTIVKYIRAYLLVMLITSVELYLGLSIIGQSYALILAIAISIIDVLPVLGTGTVLIPWGIISIVSGSTWRGIAIIVLYIIITVVRQILEPKIVGQYIGLYPLITLIAMYAGLRIFGILGMFLFPITIIILKELNQNGSVHLWKDPPGTNTEKVPAGARIVKRITKSKKYKAEVKDKDNGKKKEKK